jgi:hypothetical protein
MAVESASHGYCLAPGSERLGLSDWLDLSELKKPKLTTVILVIGAVAGVFLFADYIYNALQRRLPAVEVAQGQLQADVKQLHDLLNGDLSVRLKGMTDQMTALSSQMTGMSAQMLEVRTSVMTLCAAVRGGRTKICDFKAMLSDAKTLSRIQALFVDGGRVTITPSNPIAPSSPVLAAQPPPTPAVASAAIKEQLPTVTWGTMGVTTFVGTTATTKDNLANALVWVSAAKSAHWQQEGDSLKVHFTNGEATFEVAHDSRAHMAELVKSLNETADAIQTADSSRHTADEGPAPKR